MEKTKKLIFSFIIPAHNEEDVIENCIKSILSQSEKNWEIIVVNDGSIDNTQNVIQDIVNQNKKVKLISNTRGTSAAYARNRGAERAKGDYLIFLDADQILEKDFLIKLLDLFQSNKFEIGAIRILSKKPKSIFQRGWHSYRQYNKCATPIVKKTLFDKIKYNEDLFYVEDDVLFEDARKLGHRIIETDAWVYHIDPKTFKDNWRQRKWQGRGMVMKIFRLKKYWAIRHFLPCLILPLMFFWIYILPIYLLVIWIFFSIKSKEVMNSFFWIVADFIGRFISLFYFLVYSLAAIIKGEII